MIVEELFGVLGLKIDEGAWSRGDKMVSGLKSAVTALAVAFGIREIASAIMKTVELGSALNDTAQKTGLTVKALQYYGYVAKINSSNGEEFALASEHLAKNLEATATSAAPAAEALKKLGIGINDPAFKNANADDKIRIIAEHLSKLPDGVQKTAIAMDLFGRSGAQLIPTLNDLGKNGAQLSKEFDEFGGGLTKEQTEALDQFGDDIDRTKTRLGLLKDQIVAKLLPTLQGMLNGLTKWIQANKDLIASGIEGFVQLLIVALKGAAAAFQAVVTVVRFFQEHGELARAVIGGLIGILGAFAIAAVAAWVAASGPIIPIIAAVTAVAFAVQRLVRLFKEGGPTMKQVLSSLGFAAAAAGAAMVVGLGPISATIAAIVASVTLLISKWDDVKKIADTVFGGIDLGKLFPQGQFGGAPSSSGQATSSSQDGILNAAANPLAGPSLPTMSAPVNQQTNTITLSAPITVNGAPGMSPNDIGKAVADHLQRAVNGAYDAIRGGHR